MSKITPVAEVAPKLLPNRRSPELSEFVVGPNNRIAHAMLLALAEGSWQVEQNPMVLVGGCGVGKSHLLRATGRAFIRTHRLLPKDVVYTTAESFLNWFLVAVREKGQSKIPLFRRWSRETKLLLVDEVGFFAGKKSTQEEFLAVLDERLRMGRPTVCASNVPVRSLDLSAPLRSRLMGGVTIELGPLTLEVRLGILDQLITKAGQETSWPKTARQLLAEKLDGDARAVMGTFNALGLLSRSLGGSPIDETLIERVLAVYGFGEKLPELSLESIEEATERHFGLVAGGSHQLRSPSRSRDICYPRQVAMYLAKQLLPGLSFSEIGNHFGGRDHTTALSAISKVDRGRKEKGPVVRDLDAICSLLGAKWPL